MSMFMMIIIYRYMLLLLSVVINEGDLRKRVETLKANAAIFRNN
jgi:hypothetical protein